jgi:Fe-S cluster biogenesis protein NfuA
MGLMDRMREALGRTQPEPPLAAPAAEAQDDWLEVSISQPAEEAVTCQIRFDRAVSPPGTSLFETPQEAGDWPAVAALLSIPGVHSVIGKGDVLVVARRDDTAWSELLAHVEGAIRAAFEGAPADRGSLLPRPDDGPRDVAADADLRERVQAVIDQEINPAVADHGGYITLLDVQGSRVFIHMGGGCQGCAMSTATLKHGVETTLRTRIPEVAEILDTTDHAAGENPFFQS